MHTLGRSAGKDKVGDVKFLFDRWSAEHVLFWLKGTAFSSPSATYLTF